MEQKNKQLQQMMLAQQKKQIEAHFEKITENIDVLNQLATNLKDLSQLKQKSKSFFSLGGGIFIEGELNPLKEVLMNVGAGVTVKKDVEKAKQILAKQIQDLTKIKQKMEQDIYKINLQLQSAQQD